MQVNSEHTAFLVQTYTQRASMLRQTYRYTWRIFFHPDYDCRLWLCTTSTWALWGARRVAGLAPSRLTADRELHPAL